MNVADYPRMKDESRKKFFRKMNKVAYPKGLVQLKEISFEDFARKMKDGQ